MRCDRVNRAAALWAGSATWIWMLICPCSRASARDAELRLPVPAGRVVDFRRDVLPVLSRHCFSCHADDKTEGALKLNSHDKLLAGGQSGPAVVPGKSAESLLIRLTAGHDPDRVMPAEGEPLSAEQIGVLRAWIDQGARWSEVRDYALKLNDVALPPGEGHPIDRLLAAYFAAHGIVPGDDLEDARFARRTSLDLLGIPPSSPQLEAFQADQAPD